MPVLKHIKMSTKLLITKQSHIHKVKTLTKSIKFVGLDSSTYNNTSAQQI